MKKESEMWEIKKRLHARYFAEKNVEKKHFFFFGWSVHSPWLVELEKQKLFISLPPTRFFLDFEGLGSFLKENELSFFDSHAR